MNMQCPECDCTITIGGNVVAREIFECVDCGSELVVTNVNPVKLEVVRTDGEDWGE